jgi:glycosyltransferase involved in cell wall biosynthesis
MHAISISTVTPVYSGAAYIENLIEELNAVRISFESSNLPIKLIESIFVVDACIDDSMEKLNIASLKYNWIRIIELSKNFGQHAATAAGFLYSSGDWIVSLDEDLQHHPRNILNLLEQTVLHGQDICYANPNKSTVHGSPLRDFTSRGIKWFLAHATNNPNILKFSSFRLVRGNVGRAAAAICRNESYFDIVLSWFSNRVTIVILTMVDYRYQKELKSGYSIFKLIRHGKRMIMTSKLKLLRFGILIGFMSFIISIVFVLYFINIKIFYPDNIVIRGWTSMFIATLFFGGLNALLSGLIMESGSDIISSINGKPAFFVVDRSSDKYLKESFSKN